MSDVAGTFDAAPDEIDDHRPAAKLVYLVLAEDGPLSSREISEITRLPGRTVRQEASRLTEDGLVEQRPRTNGDARGLLYDVA